MLLLNNFNASSQSLLTVEEAVATAIKNNYDIQLLKNDAALAALNKSYANAAFFPRVNGNLGTVFNNLLI